MKIVSRNSKLALIQSEIVRKRMEKAFPNLEIEILAKPSRGDLDPETPIFEMDSRDVFTSDIDEMILARKADFAVHSMKDLSSEILDDPAFFHAVVERELPHDVVIFNKNCRQKKVLKIGTSSLRRAALVPRFLKKSLPYSVEIKILPIRGNVDTRLQKLKNGDFDAIVLAFAGLNRLAKNDFSFAAGLREDFDFMILPLFECPPAASQGALAVSCLRRNSKAVAILKRLNQVKLYKKLDWERQMMKKYGGGCHQKYGVVVIDFKDGRLLNISGFDSVNQPIDDILFEINFILHGKSLFSASDFMGDFFENDFFENVDFQILENKKDIFISHHRAVFDKNLTEILKQKNVWTAGTKTWFELAKKGIWVSGCSDGFGFDFLKPLWKSDLIDVLESDILTITNENAAENATENRSILATYRLKPLFKKEILDRLRSADAIFWTSFAQFEFYQKFVKPGAFHLCPSGKTADLIQKTGAKPIVFPTIKAFQVWRKTGF